MENGIASLGKERFAANSEEVFYIESNNPLKTKITIENNSTLDINKTKVSVNSIEIDSSSKIMFEINETSGGVLEGVGINPKITIKDGKTLNLIPIISIKRKGITLIRYTLIRKFDVVDNNGHSNIIFNLVNFNFIIVKCIFPINFFIKTIIFQSSYLFWKRIFVHFKRSDNI